MAYRIKKDVLITTNEDLIHLPYDQYRKINDQGMEPLPKDVYNEDENGRWLFARAILERNVRNMIRRKIMQACIKTSDSANNVPVKRKSTLVNLNLPEVSSINIEAEK